MLDVLLDFRDGWKMRELWLFLGWRDTRKHYSRSILGPFWITLSTGILVAGLGVLYSQIFGQNIAEYLPFLAVGFIAWGLISGIIIGSCSVFYGAAGTIRQIRLPLTVYIFQFVWQQFIGFAHNFVIYIVVAVIFGIWPGFTGLLLIPALLLVGLNGIFASLILGPICARFRDVPMIVSSSIQIFFFMTPIMWNPNMLPNRASFVTLNPFYHFIEIIRAPLLGSHGHLMNWVVCIAITFLLGIASVSFFTRYRNRIPYWA